MATTWIKRWQAEIAATRLPGVWKLKTGGHLVRARASDPTGRKVEIRKRLPELDEAEAFAWLEAERSRIRSGDLSAPKAKPLFSTFALSLLEEKVATREIVSARGREKWTHTLTHLISGTGTVAGFGDLPIDRISTARTDAWRVGIAKLLRAPGTPQKKGTYSPQTVNGWIGILKVITKTARRRFKLGEDPAEDLPYFDTSEHPTFTEEEPNALTADEAKRFLAAMKSEFPQHYAMTCLGFATGLRPSQLRPLRRQGARADVKWDEQVILVRRSHTLGEIMNRTKTKLRQRVSVPPELLAVLQWHVDTQMLTEDQAESDLLFPAEDGRPRSESCLKKPFAIVSALLGITKTITPKAMRRTFNDLTRLAKVEGIVTRSISGHTTEQMREHYSTVSPDEQRAAVGTVLRVIRGGRAGGVAGGVRPRASGDGERPKRAKRA
jgi:integrase